MIKERCPTCGKFQLIEKDGGKLCLNCGFSNKPGADIEVSENWNQPGPHDSFLTSGDIGQ